MDSPIDQGHPSHTGLPELENAGQSRYLTPLIILRLSTQQPRCGILALMGAVVERMECHRECGRITFARMNDVHLGAEYNTRYREP